MEFVLSVKGLKKIYTMGEVHVQALRGIDLSLSAGEFVVLLGASGSGKSTLLNILGGLDTPTSGEVNYKGEVITEASTKKLAEFRRRHVGFVFQFYNLISNLTAGENIELVTDVATNPLSVDECLELVGLSDRKNHFPAQLSGGEQQRVSIARAISKRPDLLLCDEPTGALDVSTGKLVLKAIQKVHKELGTLVIVITHNTAIAKLADRILYLSDGQVRKQEINEIKSDVEEVSW
ncbi:MAG: ABC transporter ATP-binding protein [Pseudobdellovibrionaceae bacterium]